MEGKNDVLLPLVVAKRYLARILRWKRKIRRLLSNIYHALLLIWDSRDLAFPGLQRLTDSRSVVSNEGRVGGRLGLHPVVYSAYHGAPHAADLALPWLPAL